MKVEKLVDRSNPECVVFMAGWGMDPTPFISLEPAGRDLIFCYDYQDISLGSFMDLSARYEKLHLIAWSMGVWVGARLFSPFPRLFASTTAVNGTLLPIDERCGLSESAYRDMRDDFSLSALEGFYDEMFSEQAQRQRFLAGRPRRSLTDIHRELALLYEQYQHHGPAPDIYQTKIVGSHDRIFTLRNQTRAWGRGHCQSMRVAHFPFYTWNGLSAPSELK